MEHMVLGFAPTRRSIFSAPDAVKYANLTRIKLQELNIDFEDVDDINEEGLLFCEEDRLKVLEKFRAKGVIGLLLAHCNFGTEYIWQRTWEFRFSYGDRWMSAPNRMELVCGIPSAAYLPPAKSSGVSVCPLPI